MATTSEPMGCLGDSRAVRNRSWWGVVDLSEKENPMSEPESAVAVGPRGSLALVVNALEEKGYREIALHFDKKTKHAFQMWANKGLVLALQVYPDGNGWELLAPVHQGNDTLKTIAAIPACGD